MKLSVYRIEIIFFSLFVLAIVSGCGVKPRGPNTGDNPIIVEADLPEGVYLSTNRLYLVRPSFVSPSTEALLPFEENVMAYQVVGGKLLPEDFSQTEVEIEYIMPSMPEMGVFKAEIEVKGSGNIEALYEISMAGDWQMKLIFKKDGKPIDEIIFSYDL